MTKTIWLPETQTKVVVENGHVYLRDEIIMNLKPLNNQKFFDLDKDKSVNESG